MFMDKNGLVQLVAQRAGISESQASQAVEVVLGQLEDRLPAPVAGQIRGFLREDSGTSRLDDVAKGIGGMLGRK